MKQYHFVKFNQGLNLTLKQRWFWADTKKKLLLCYDAQEIIIFILKLKRSVFNHWNNKQNQRQNLMLKQHWLWVDPKIIFVFMV